MTGRIVIVSGPSGVGKDTVIDAWSSADPRVERVVAVTTRPPREGEVDGSDYHFVDRAVFNQMVEDGAFLEHKVVHGEMYATPMSGVQSVLDRGNFAVLKIDVQGAAAVMDKVPEVVSFFILPPSIEELERRLRSRGSESEEKVAERLQNAIREIESSEIYHYRFVNDSVERCVGEIQEILEVLSG